MSSHLDDFELERGYLISFIQSQPHIISRFGSYQPWDDNEGFIQFLTENRALVVPDYDELTGQDTYRGLVEFFFDHPKKIQG